MTQLTASASVSLDGKIICPGDKSVSHRSLISGHLLKANRITGLLTGDDVFQPLLPCGNWGDHHPATKNDHGRL